LTVPSQGKSNAGRAARLGQQIIPFNKVVLRLYCEEPELFAAF